MSKNCPPSSETQVQHHDVTVVGAGWAGLTSCKHMLEEGLTVVALEKREGIGGVWRYSEDPSVVTVMKSTQTTSSATVIEFSDFPMPHEMGSFPHHTDVLKYLHSYVEKFNLAPHIRCNSEVTNVEKTGNMWIVTCSDGTIYTSHALVMANGPFQQPNRELENTTLKDFTGKIYHAGEIKAPSQEHRGQRLLLLGGGETASDICFEWADHVQFTYWSIPRGQHFFRKYAKVVPWGQAQALDKASSRMMKAVAPYNQGKPGLAWICKWTTQGSLLAYQGHGIPEWKNDAEYFHFVINKNGRVLDKVDYKQVVPKGAIANCKGKEVTFADGTTQEFDLVIMSTGYDVRHEFLPDRYKNVRMRNKYKFVFDVEDPSIAFVGFVRPIVGSIVGITELQARWVAKVFSKKVSLQPAEERRQEVEQDVEHWSTYFKDSSQRIETLVEAFTYIDDISKKAGVYPNYWELFKRNPHHWYTAFFSPYNGATFRLNDPKCEDAAIETMKFHSRTARNPIHLLLILLLRLLWFDWWLVQIGNIKYRIQVSSWWQRVKSYGVVLVLNYLWTFPKRMLFDTSSDEREEICTNARKLVMLKNHLKKTS